MDVHNFKKSFTNSVLLEVPGILMAVLLTAGITMVIINSGLGLNGWEWEMALLLGAIVGATDPDAVGSILKELDTNIEGESLLNDGTAIVKFMVLFLGMTGEGALEGKIPEHPTEASGLSQNPKYF